MLFVGNAVATDVKDKLYNLYIHNFIYAYS